MRAGLHRTKDNQIVLVKNTGFGTLIEYPSGRTVFVSHNVKG